MHFLNVISEKISDQNKVFNEVEGGSLTKVSSKNVAIEFA
jgi:hypothetical protein